MVKLPIPQSIRDTEAPAAITTMTTSTNTRATPTRSSQR